MSMAFPKKKWQRPVFDDEAFVRRGSRPKRRLKNGMTEPRYTTSEAELQEYLDELLLKKRVPFYRVPDQVWSAILSCGVQTIIKWARHFFKSECDTTVFIPIGKYSLGLHLELKSSTGCLSRRQELRTDILPWRVATTREQIAIELRRYFRHAKMLGSVLEMYEREYDGRQNTQAVDLLYLDVLTTLKKRLPNLRNVRCDW